MSNQNEEQTNDSLFMRQLASYLDQKAELRIFLTTGVGLVGTLLDFDQDCILISSGDSAVPSLIMRENVLSLSDLIRLAPDNQRGRRDNNRRDNNRRDNHNNRDYDRHQPRRND